MGGEGTVEECRDKCLFRDAKLVEIRSDVQLEASIGVFIEFYVGYSTAYRKYIIFQFINLNIDYY